MMPHATSACRHAADRMLVMLMQWLIAVYGLVVWTNDTIAMPVNQYRQDAV